MRKRVEPGGKTHFSELPTEKGMDSVRAIRITPGHSGPVMHFHTHDTQTGEAICSELSASGIEATVGEDRTNQNIITAKNPQEVFIRALTLFEEKGYVKPAFANRVRDQLPDAVSYAEEHSSLASKARSSGQHL